MVFRLTDFKYEIDLFLFDTGFERWWKLREGTLIAVLNPGVMPPRQKDTGAFNLKVTSSEDTVLEIGQARDLGFCKSVKADGHQCTAWVDKRKTEVCEYHISLQVDKARADRMQFNTMTGGPGAGRGGRGGRSSAYTRTINQKNSKYVNNFGGLAKEGMYHDVDLHETMWITPKEMGLNAANLLDKEFMDQMMDKEAKRKRERDKEKEEELAKSLGLRGNGTGSEYLKHRSSLKESKDRRTTTMASLQAISSTRDAASSTATLETPDAASLGLLGKTAQQVSLSPVKRKLNSSTGSTTSATPMGWSGAFKRGLLDKPDQPAPGLGNTSQQKKMLLSPRKSSMRQAQEDGSPRKKARLLLEGKGVRVPGRESLGATPGDVFLEDEDDELEIV
jgi:minichromosome maintenance protein 10